MAAVSRLARSLAVADALPFGSLQPRWSLRQIAVAAALSTMLIMAVLSVGDVTRLMAAAQGLLARPELLALFLLTYTLAFYLRALAWRLLLPGHHDARRLFSLLQVALLANHLFPAKVGEVVRVALLARRGVPIGAAASSTMLARLMDFGVVCLIAIAFGAMAGGSPDVLLALLILPLGGVGLGVVLCSLIASGRRLPFGSRLPARVEKIRGEARAALGAVSASRLIVAAALVLPSWLLEAGALWSVARAAGEPLSLTVAAGATAFAIAFQGFQIAPGGLGVYEASLTGILALYGVDPATGLALALATHALKFAYSYLIGFPCLLVESLPSSAPARRLLGAAGKIPLLLPSIARQWWLAHRPLPPPGPVPQGSVVAILIPVHDEAPTILSVIAGIPRRQLRELGYETRAIVVDDGSTDSSGQIARQAGADLVVTHPTRRGLGAALRTALATAKEIEAGAAVYLDGDGEYDPADILTVASPVLRGEADYVLGSRFPQGARLMRPSRRLGNVLFTVLVSLMTGQRLRDGQTGFRAFSQRAVAKAEIIHDYNYAQVLTLDLLRKRMRLAQPSIGYRTRQHGQSFIHCREYLGRVLPAMVREVLGP
ncbi:MAG: flippase-like domain-containing protein [Chloroflexi bacterium]|nr:flippase-like domain-containing protein [Chloroflexota bacterium]